MTCGSLAYPHDRFPAHAGYTYCAPLREIRQRYNSPACRNQNQASVRDDSRSRWESIQTDGSARISARTCRRVRYGSLSSTRHDRRGNRAGVGPVTVLAEGKNAFAAARSRCSPRRQYNTRSGTGGYPVQSACVVDGLALIHKPGGAARLTHPNKRDFCHSRQSAQRLNNPTVTHPIRLE